MDGRYAAARHVARRKCPCRILRLTAMRFERIPTRPASARSSVFPDQRTPPMKKHRRAITAGYGRLYPMALAKCARSPFREKRQAVTIPTTPLNGGVANLLPRIHEHRNDDGIGEV